MVGRRLGPNKSGIVAVSTWVGAAAFAGVLAIEHIALHDRSPLSHFVSEYSHDPAGQVLNLVAFLALGAGSASLAVGLSRVLPPSRTTRAAAILLSVWAVSWVPAAVFVTDVGLPARTTAGAVHSISVLTGTICFAAALFVYAAVFRSSPRWRPLTPVTLAVACAVIVLLNWAIAAPTTPAVGVIQRCSFALVLAWLSLTAATLYSTARKLRPRTSGLETILAIRHNPDTPSASGAQSRPGNTNDREGAAMMNSPLQEAGDARSAH